MADNPCRANLISQDQKQKEVESDSWRRARPELNRPLAQELLKDTPLRRDEEPAPDPASVSEPVLDEPAAEQAMASTSTSEHQIPVAEAAVDLYVTPECFRSPG